MPGSDKRFLFFFLVTLFVLPPTSWSMESVESTDTALLIIEKHINTIFIKNGIPETSNINYQIQSETITDHSIAFQGTFSIDANGNNFSGHIDWNANESSHDGSLQSTIDFNVVLNHGPTHLGVEYLSTTDFGEDTQTENISYEFGQWSFTANKSLQISETANLKTTTINVSANDSGTEYNTSALITKNKISPTYSETSSIIEEFELGDNATSNRIETEYYTDYSQLEAKITYTKLDIFKDDILIFQRGQKPITNLISMSGSNYTFAHFSEVNLISLVEGQNDISYKLHANNFLGGASENSLKTADHSIDVEFLLKTNDKMEIERYFNTIEKNRNQNDPHRNTKSRSEQPNDNNVNSDMILTAGEVSMVTGLSGYVTADLLCSSLGWAGGPAGVAGMSIGAMIGASYLQWKKSGYTMPFEFKFEFKNDVIKSKHWRSYPWVSSPSLNQWKKVIFALLIIASGCNATIRKGGYKSSADKAFAFSLPIFIKALNYNSFGVFVLCISSFLIFGIKLSQLDILGFIIATVLFSYITHLLWIISINGEFESKNI